MNCSDEQLTEQSLKVLAGFSSSLQRKSKQKHSGTVCSTVWPYPNFALLSLWNIAKMVIKAAVKRVSNTVKVWVSYKKWEMRLTKKTSWPRHTQVAQLFINFNLTWSQQPTKCQNMSISWKVQWLLSWKKVRSSIQQSRYQMTRTLWYAGQSG